MNPENNNYMELFSDMVQKIRVKTKLYAVILFGSRGRGNPHQHSDYDVIVIADFQIEYENYFDRLYWISSLAPQLPIDLFCYTPKEFETMFSEYRITAMDAMEDGIVLWGDDFIQSYKKRYEAYKTHGLRREKCVLIPPIF
jgi:predicted nucleotidyltransferase